MTSKAYPFSQHGIISPEEAEQIAIDAVRDMKKLDIAKKQAEAAESCPGLSITFGVIRPILKGIDYMRPVNYKKKIEDGQE